MASNSKSHKFMKINLQREYIEHLSCIAVRSKMDAPAHTTSAASKLEKIRAKLAAERSMDKLTGTANDGNNGHSADMQAAKRHSSGDKLELNEDNQTLEAASDDEDEDHNGGILGHTTNIVGSAVGGVTSLLSSAAAAVSGAVFSAAAVVLESVAGKGACHNSAERSGTLAVKPRAKYCPTYLRSSPVALVAISFICRCLPSTRSDTTSQLEPNRWPFRSAGFARSFCIRRRVPMRIE